MIRHTSLAHEFVEYIPSELADGVLYISIPYRTAVHRCACGCGNKVVTPISPADWQLFYDGDTVSLTPSIGNWGFPCRSHYWINAGRIRWARHGPASRSLSAGHAMTTGGPHTLPGAPRIAQASGQPRRRRPPTVRCSAVSYVTSRRSSSSASGATKQAGLALGPARYPKLRHRWRRSQGPLSGRCSLVPRRLAPDVARMRDWRNRTGRGPPSLRSAPG